jgi:hypothetical protein
LVLFLLVWSCYQKEIIESSKITEIKKEETTNWETYRNEEYGFEIKYPQDYTKQKAESEDVLLNIIKYGKLSDLQILNRTWRLVRQMLNTSYSKSMNPWLL